jgi:hypothetical protein
VIVFDPFLVVSVYKVSRQWRDDRPQNAHLATGETAVLSSSRASPKKSGQAFLNFLDETPDSMDKH